MSERITEDQMAIPVILFSFKVFCSFKSFPHPLVLFSLVEDNVHHVAGYQGLLIGLYTILCKFIYSNLTTAEPILCFYISANTHPNLPCRPLHNKITNIMLKGWGADIFIHLTGTIILGAVHCFDVFFILIQADIYWIFTGFQVKYVAQGYYTPLI